MTWNSILKQYTNPYPLESNQEFYGVSPRYHPPGFVPYSSSKRRFEAGVSGKSQIATESSGYTKSTHSRGKSHHLHKYISCNCCPGLAAMKCGSSSADKRLGGRKCEVCDKIKGKIAKKDSSNSTGDASLQRKHGQCCCYCCRCPCHQHAREKDAQRQKDGLTSEPVQYIFAQRPLPKSDMSIDASSNAGNGGPNQSPAFDAGSLNQQPGSRYMLEDLMRGLQWGQWRSKLSDPVLSNVKQKILKQNGRSRMAPPPDIGEVEENEEGGKVYKTYVDFLTKDRAVRNTNTFKSPVWRD